MISMGSAKSPLISCVLPVYNGERFIRESVDSILGQSFHSFELIVIDDASTDGTNGILKQYEDRRIRIICNERNQGAGGSREVGLKAASGKYIAMMDSDDVSCPERFAEEAGLLDRNPDVALVGTASILVDRNGSITGYRQVFSGDAEIRKCLSVKLLPFEQGTSMFRRDMLEDVGGYAPLRLAEDHEFWIRIASGDKYKFAGIQKFLYKKRIHQNQITSSSLIETTEYSSLTHQRASRLRSNCGDLHIRISVDRRSSPADRKGMAYLYFLYGYKLSQFGEVSAARDAYGRAFRLNPLKPTYFLCFMMSRFLSIGNIIRYARFLKRKSGVGIKLSS